MEAPLIWLQSGFDLVLAGTLVGFAAIMLTTPNLFQSIVLFIVFGLLMALTWARLDAVDVAIAEAAIGAGLTGALLLNARADLDALQRRRRRERRGSLGVSVDAPPPGARRWVRSLVYALLPLPLFAMVAWATLSVPSHLPGMGPEVLAAMDDSGAHNPVTAVLLNFRAYDTLLEVAILLLAVVATWSQGLGVFPPRDRPPGLVLLAAMRLLVPLAVLVAGYLLWRGTHAPGGAFQAGAVLAGAGVLLLLGEHALPKQGRHLPLRMGLALGVLAFLVAGLAGLLLGGAFLFYRGERAATWILIIEVAATVSIALSLVALFAGRSPTPTEGS
jgi:multisubunit Na+/H+ antiporter MnhB subunit